MEPMIDTTFWKDKRVFITGHTGFKGSWLSFWLHKLGADVTGYAFEPSDQQPLFSQLRLSSYLADHRGDVTDLHGLQDILTNSQPQIVIHLAAQSLVRESYRQPITTFSTNIMGVANILEAARSVPSIRSMLIVTSDKCYENLETRHSFVESDQLGGRDPYSSSKGCAEMVTRAYRDSFFNEDATSRVGIASARAGNVIGGGDWAKDRLIPDAMREFSRGRSLSVRFPAATRPWQHVLEPLSGYLLLSEKLWENPIQFSGGWNFGPKDDSIATVSTVATLLAESYGSPANWKALIEEQGPYEATLLQLDISKAINELNWIPRWNLQTAVDQTVEWYKSLESGDDMRNTSTRQLERYARTIDKH